MEARDKITEKFREAARKIEAGGDFPGMDSVWTKIEERLEERPERKVLPLKRWSIAAAILLLVSAGSLYLVLREHKEPEALPGLAQRKDSLGKPPAQSKEILTHKEETVAPELAVSPGTQPSRLKRPASQVPVRTAPDEELKPDAVAMGPADPAQVPIAGVPSQTVKGRVVDANGDPVPGSMVKVKGANNLTVTDINGNFELKVAANGPQELEISSVGFDNLSLPLAHYDAAKAIRLGASSNQLSEIAVVQPYSPATEKFTGAADVITGKQPDKMPVTNMTGTIGGSVPGVQVAQGGQPDNNPRHMLLPPQVYQWNNSVGYNYYSQDQHARDINPYRITGSTQEQSLAKVSAAPNTAASLAGNATADPLAALKLSGADPQNAGRVPLLIVDGTPFEGDVNAINPSEVASVTVLPDDTATALYGSRSANGVVIVTTKKEVQHNADTVSAEKKGKYGKRIRSGVIGILQLLFSGEKRTGALMPEATTEVAAKEELIEVDQESYESYVENAFEDPLLAPLSTFSIDVDNASYTNIRRFINDGEMVPKDAVRVEEMINFFHYAYPQPGDEHPFSISTEYSDAPWNAKHKLLKIGLQGKIISPDKLPAANLVFLVDVSGSMDEPDKLPLLQASLKLLTEKLRAEDKVSIVVYAGSAGLVLPPTSGSDKQKIREALDRLEAGGSTAGGEGIALAYQIAAANFIKGGNNRVILATDGDFNVGASSDAEMQALIEKKREQGISLTCLGYGMGNYKDSKMEILADKGNGNYAYIDNMQEASRFLVKEFGGTLFSIAKDVKIQVGFNPHYVQSYRLIGYENRKLRAEDFANDTIDAGELGSGHTVTALYEIIPVGTGSGYSQQSERGCLTVADTWNTFRDALAIVKFRYKKPDEHKSNEIVQAIRYKPGALASASPDFKFSAAVAWFGLKLRNSQLVPDKTREHILRLAKEGTIADDDGYRAEFTRLVEAVQ